jgi:oligopeptide transport system substrate-binding protein
MHSLHRTFSLRRGAAFTALTLLLSTLTGCSNNPYPAQEHRASTIYRTFLDDPKTLDPSVCYVALEIPGLIYSCFYQYHYLKRDPITLDLDLGAEEAKRELLNVTVMEKGKPVQKRGEQWTFRIKSGVRFQDDPCFPGGKGREVTVDDFLFAFRRMADPSVGSPVVSFVEDKILGFAELSAKNRALVDAKKKADYETPIEGLERVDNYTFRIKLNQPYPQLRYLMATWFTAPQAHEALAMYKKDIARHPVGCGPYILSEYQSKRRMVLTKNPNYREEFYPSEGAPGDAEKGLLKDAGKRLPLTDTIVYMFLREGITGWNLFLQGYYDEWAVNPVNYNQVIDTTGGLSNEMRQKGIELKTATKPNTNYFAFNMDDPIVGGYTPQKRKLRQALSLALDAQVFLDLFYQGNGTLAEWIIPPGLFGYDPNYKNPYRTNDLEKAKKLLAEAGYPNGINPKTGDRLTLYYENPYTAAGGRRFIALVQKQFEALGIKVEPRTSRFPIWYEKIKKGKYQFYDYNWLADYPDAENFVFLLYGPNKIDGGPNTSRYDNPEYNRLFEQMRAMDDTSERLEIINKMRAMAVEDCPWVYLYHSATLNIHYDWLANVKPHPVALNTSKYFRLDPEKRANLRAAWNRPNYWPAVGLVLFLFVGSIPAAGVVRNRSSRRARRDQKGETA